MEIKKVVYDVPTVTNNKSQHIRIRKVRFLCTKHAERYEGLYNTHVYPLTFFEKIHHKNMLCFDCTLNKEFVNVRVKR